MNKCYLCGAESAIKCNNVDESFCIDCIKEVCSKDTIEDCYKCEKGEVLTIKFEVQESSEYNYEFCEIYFINSVKFKLHYHHIADYMQMIKAVDNFMQNRKPGQNSEVVFLPGGCEIRVVFTSRNCASVYYKRKQDLE